MPVEELRNNGMMAHLIAALERGEDIGHYGRLVFAMIARHFITEEELVEYLQCNVDEDEARALCAQVEDRDYNPPRRERIMEWQEQQAFPICPDGESCNVYRDLKFPEHVYQHIQEFYAGRS